MFFAQMGMVMGAIWCADRYPPIVLISRCVLSYYVGWGYRVRFSVILWPMCYWLGVMIVLAF